MYRLKIHIASTHLICTKHIIFLFSDPKNEVPKEEEPSGKSTVVEKPTLHLKYRPIKAYQPYLAPAHPTQLYFSSIHPGILKKCF